MIPAAFAPLASHLWQSTLFASVAGLLTLALRRNQARVRYWVWLAASYKFLVPFSWLMSIGHRFEWHAAPAILPPPAFSAVTDMVSGAVFLPAVPSVNPLPNHPPVLLFAIWGVWACGFVFVSVGWARQWLRIRRILRAASPLQLEIPIQVASTSAQIEPGVVGVVRPVLLLPQGIADRLTKEQLQAVLAHELCHVRRRDNLAAAVHMLVEALFWFHPLVWWLGARMLDERERACDEEVLRAGSQAQVYAESILKVCEFYLESPLTCVSGVTGSELKERIQRIMKEHFGVALSAPKKLLLVTAGMSALAIPIVAGALMASAKVPAVQSDAVPQWQTDAGGAMSFDVAFVKHSGSGSSTESSNVPLGPGEFYSPSGGVFSAVNFPLINYIGFAYKLTANQALFLLSELPGWATKDKFDIQARARSNPTKDQMRLMMQSLLVNRFKLAVHFETRQVPVYELVQFNPGKLGANLRPHSDDQPCITDPRLSTVQATVPGGYPELCGAITTMPNKYLGGVRIGGRNVTVDLIAATLPTEPDGADRPVLDRTGLSGTVDFVVEWKPQPNLPAGVTDPDPPQPTFKDALEKQLGLKLDPQTGPVDVLVVDHVEELPEN
jgi:bla regulator protein blaR1